LRAAWNQHLAGYGLARPRVKLGFMCNDDFAFFIMLQRMMPPAVYTGFSIPLATWFTQSYFKRLVTGLLGGALE
jgi:hypothetical protein